MKRIIGLLAAALLAGCSPKAQHYTPAQGYENIRINDDSLLAADGVVLPLRSFLSQGKPKAVVIALHGFNDYSRAFVSTGLYFQSQGIALFAYDQRGFGATAYTGIWPRQENLVSDLKQAVLQAKRRYPDTPVFVMGESMGGAVAVIAGGGDGFPHINGLILVAPALWGGESMSPIYRASLWAMVHIIPDSEFTGRNFKRIACDDYSVLERMARDPLVQKKARLDAVYGLVRLMDEAYASVPRLPMPVLLLYGAHDQIIPKPPIESSLPRFTTRLQYVYYPEGYHMLLRDLRGRMVQQDIAGWMLKPGSAVQSGYGKWMDSHI